MAKPTIRFRGFDDEWEQRKLGELVGIYDGVHQTPEYQTSEQDTFLFIRMKILA